MFKDTIKTVKDTSFNIQINNLSAIAVALSGLLAVTLRRPWVAGVTLGKLVLHLVQLNGPALFRHGVEPLDALAQLAGQRLPLRRATVGETGNVVAAASGQRLEPADFLPCLPLGNLAGLLADLDGRRALRLGLGLGRLRQARKGPLLAFLHDRRRMVPGVFPGRLELLGDGKLCACHVQRQATACGFCPLDAGIERAEAAGGGLALDVARAQLAVAQEFQAAGKDPRHHSAAIMQEGQQRAFAGLAQPSQAKAEPERPAAVQVSEQARKVAEGQARQEVSRFKTLAAGRRNNIAGFTDRSPSKWQALPGELRERIERFNAMPEQRRAVELDKMQNELAERYARDPRAAQRDREQSRQRDGYSR